MKWEHRPLYVFVGFVLFAERKMLLFLPIATTDLCNGYSVSFHGGRDRIFTLKEQPLSRTCCFAFFCFSSAMTSFTLTRRHYLRYGAWRVVCVRNAVTECLMCLNHYNSITTAICYSSDVPKTLQCCRKNWRHFAAKRIPEYVVTLEFIFSYLPSTMQQYCGM
jgi:hypothetical protein